MSNEYGVAVEKGVMVEDEWGKKWELLTQRFTMHITMHQASGVWRVWTRG